MNIVGHWLEVSTGKELPVVMAPVTYSHTGDFVDLDGVHVPFTAADGHIEGEKGLTVVCPVVVDFVPNPEAEIAFRQMMDFDGPAVLPRIVAIYVNDSLGDNPVICSA